MRRAFAILLILLYASPVFASIIRHKVKAGETVQSLARFYYGDEKKALYIIKANSLDPKKTLKPGKTTLKIPFVTIYKVKRKGTFKALATKHLNDPKKAKALAMLNGMDENAVLPAGYTVKIPFNLFYRVEPGDTLTILADKFFGDQTYAAFIKAYNRIEDVREIQPGQKLTIPIMAERAKVGYPPVAGAEKKPEVKKIDPSLYRKDLDKAVSQFEEGEYRASIETLRSILLKVGEEKILKGDRVKVHQYMAFNYIALDEDEAAKGEFLELLKVNPKFQLPPKDTSPKIIAVFKKIKR